MYFMVLNYGFEWSTHCVLGQLIFYLCICRWNWLFGLSVICVLEFDFKASPSQFRGHYCVRTIVCVGVCYCLAVIMSTNRTIVLLCWLTVSRFIKIPAAVFVLSIIQLCNNFLKNIFSTILFLVDDFSDWFNPFAHKPTTWKQPGVAKPAGDTASRWVTFPKWWSQ